MIKLILTLLLLSLASGQTGSIQLTPSNPTLWAQTSYLVSYYTFSNMPSASTFVLNFSATYITVPPGTLNISTVLNSTAVSGAAASCNGSLCTIKLNRMVSGSTNIKITIGSFTNPYFLRAQPVTASVTYNASYTESLAYTIGTDQYSPMPITSNSLKQSDYGVGNTGVNYLFNFSAPMSPASVQLSLTIPPQVTQGTVQVSLVYYGA
jgi:hypothetical protein